MVAIRHRQVRGDTNLAEPWLNWWLKLHQTATEQDDGPRRWPREDPDPAVSPQKDSFCAYD